MTEDLCEECGAHPGIEHELWCSNHGLTCPTCGRDYEGCECSRRVSAA